MRTRVSSLLCSVSITSGIGGGETGFSRSRFPPNVRTWPWRSSTCFWSDELWALKTDSSWDCVSSFTCISSCKSGRTCRRRVFTSISTSFSSCLSSWFSCPWFSLSMSSIMTSCFWLSTLSICFSSISISWRCLSFHWLRTETCCSSRKFSSCNDLFASVVKLGSSLTVSWSILSSAWLSCFNWEESLKVASSRWIFCFRISCSISLVSASSIFLCKLFIVPL